jgi:hypothetical protein
MTSDHKKPTAGFWITVALVAVLAYPISFGPACRLLPRSYITAFYRPCVSLALDGPQQTRVPLMWWVETCGGGMALTILSIERTPPARLVIQESGEGITEGIQIGDKVRRRERQR